MLVVELYSFTTSSKALLYTFLYISKRLCNEQVPFDFTMDRLSHSVKASSQVQRPEDVGSDYFDSLFKSRFS
uniref:Uncharacterized protein n=1 Tax=Arundo donax TaxID=35708 RepID=A0A0A8Y6X0_ARUDO